MNTSTKTPEHGLRWALNRLAQLQGVHLDPLRLADAFAGISATEHPTDTLQHVCTQLELAKPTWLNTPDAPHLPLLCYVLGEWGVVCGLEHTADWRVLHPGQERVYTAKQLQDRVAQVQCDSARACLVDQSDLKPGAAAVTFHDQLQSALRAHRTELLEAAAASVFISMLALATSLFSMQVYDRVIPAHAEYTLVVLSFGVFFSILIELALKMARGRLMDHVVSGVDSDLSRKIFKRFLDLRVDQLPASVGSLAGQMRGYEMVRSFYTTSTLFTAVDVPMALLFLVIVGVLATPLLALMLLVFAVGTLMVGLSLRRQVMRLAQSGASYSNMKTGLLVEAVEGAETIKAGAGGWKFLSQWIKVNQAAIQNDAQMRNISERTNFLGGTVQQLSYASLIAAGALTVINGQMSMGALIACSILSGRILTPILSLPGMLVQHAHAKAAQDGLERLYQLKTDHHGVDRPLVPSRISGDYTLSEVAFTYGDNPSALRVNSLKIRAGERIAILGPIGAGKSTLLRLLSGLYVPQTGRVLLDGLDMSHISHHVLSRQIGYLQQEHRLFQGSLRDNILIGLPDPGDDAILAAMRRTGMDRMVRSHPRGLDLRISEGGKGLSGGQRQLLAFTRLVLCNPDILLLDEPTATMDDEQESRCLAVLDEEIRRGKTLVVVTHKPRVLPLVDRVIVVAGSTIVMDGPRDEILRKLSEGVNKIPPKPTKMPVLRTVAQASHE